jgi:ketosteroid isomerase-like protein
MLKLESPIQAMIDATNRDDSAALLTAFADDAVLTDFGRAFKGKAEIARWNDDENIGTQNRLRVTSVTRSGKTVSVKIAVTGNGYNGPGTLKFELEGESIKRLVITG